MGMKLDVVGVGIWIMWRGWLVIVDEAVRGRPGLDSLALHRMSLYTALSFALSIEYPRKGLHQYVHVPTSSLPSTLMSFPFTIPSASMNVDSSQSPPYILHLSWCRCSSQSSAFNIQRGVFVMHGCSIFGDVKRCPLAPGQVF